MSSAATLASPVYIQQSFDWDSTPSASSAYASAYATSDSISSSTVQRSARASQSTTTRSRKSTANTVATGVIAPSKVAPSRAKAKPAVTVPTYEQTSSVRRGRCEHVGGILVSVLSKYGIGIDEFLAELDGNK